jgi:phospholipid/cholesterol/gamma-HCH transport system substrate-binding protein
VRVWTVSFPRTGGLGRSDEVQVNGIRKGAVQDMELAGDHVIVRLALAHDIVLTSDCRVAISNVGLMGEKVIAVDLRTSGRHYTERDTIRGDYEQGIPEVMGQMGGTIQTLTRLTEHLERISGALARSGDLERSVSNFAVTSVQLREAVAENRRTLKATLDNFAAASRSARALTVDREAQLREAVDDFAAAAEKMDRLAGRLDSLRASVASVTAKVDRGDGTLGRLVNDQRLYDDLNTSVRSLKALIEDIQKNPKKYIHLSIF